MIATERIWIRAAAGLFMFAWLSCGAVAKQVVDAELVLAVDVSRSISRREQRLQRDGYVAAFTSLNFVEAVLSGPNRRIAVTYFEWAGKNHQSVVVPWRLIESSADAFKFARELSAREPTRAMMTSISGAILKGKELLENSAFISRNRIIDISGDGPNNDGLPVMLAREQVVAVGITINALSIHTKKHAAVARYLDIADLDEYFRRCVIGGQGAFVTSIKTAGDFKEVIFQKLIMEISGVNSEIFSLFNRVSSGKGIEKYDCLIGEKLLKQFFRERFGN